MEGELSRGPRFLWGAYTAMACLGGFLRFPQTSQNRLGLGLGLLARRLKRSRNSCSRRIYRLAKRLPSSSRTTSMQDTTRSITQLSGRSIRTCNVDTCISYYYSRSDGDEPRRMKLCIHNAFTSQNMLYIVL